MSMASHMGVKYQRSFIQNGRNEEDLKIDYFKKIPDIVELPITVVNNVLYAQLKFDDDKA